MPDQRVTELALIDTVTGTDLVMVIDDPSGSASNKKATVDQLLVDVARTDVSNTFAGDQTVDGDLFVTGEINPVFLRAQKAKIDLFTGLSPGDPSGSRTVMTRSGISGLAVRHDEDLGHGRVSVGNYDLQLYQPLLFEVETFQVHTGVSPGNRVERLRVHPTGGVTVGDDHSVDPGDGVMQAGSLRLTTHPHIEVRGAGDPDERYFRIRAINGTLFLQPVSDAGVLGFPYLQIQSGGDLNTDGRFNIAGGLGATPLNATNLTTGTVPAARLPLRYGTIGIVLDGAGTVITTGAKGFFEVGAACIITAVTLLSTDPAATIGSIVIDIWKAAFANYPPTAANTITASARPTLAADNKSRDTTLAGWTTAIAAGDILAFNVVSASLVTKVSLTLTVQL